MKNKTKKVIKDLILLAQSSAQMSGFADFGNATIKAAEKLVEK